MARLPRKVVLVSVAVCGLVLLSASIVYPRTRMAWFSSVHPQRRKLGAEPDLSLPNPEEVCKDIWMQALMHDSEDPKPYGQSAKTWDGLPHDGKPTHHEVVVAVGKSAGKSLLMLLERKGLLTRFDWIHMHPVRHKVLKDKALMVLSVRDPVARLVSSFKFLYTEESEGKKKGQTGPGGAQRIFFDCFPSLGKFVDGLDEDTICGLNARASLVTIDVFRKHLNRGICYYLGGVLDELSEKARNAKVVVVDAISFRSDFNHLMEAMGKNYSRLNSDGEIPHEHDGSHAPISVKLSEEQRNRLRRHLNFEYAAYNAILALRETQ